MAWNHSILMNFIYSFHMPLFVFLSGLVSITAIEWKAILNDMWKRFRTILVPGLIVGSVYSLTFNHDFSFLTNEYKKGYWYLWVLFVFYLFNYIPAIYAGRSRKSSIVIYVIIAFLWILANHYVKYASTNIRTILSLDLIVKYFPYYMLANAIKRYRLHGILFNNSLVLLVSIIVCMSHSLFNFKYSEYFTTTASIIVIIQICKIIDDMGKGNANCCVVVLSSFLSKLGTKTLYIYVFQYFVLGWLSTTYFKNTLCKYSNLGWDLIICIIPTILCIFSCLGIKMLFDAKPNIRKLVFGK